MAGVILVIMGLTGTGTAVKYIPRPVVIGFTNGIALVIISTQLRDFLGLEIEVPGEFMARLEAIGANLRAVSADSVALGGGILLLLIVWSRYVKRVPAYIVALFVGTAAAAVLELDVATIGSRFGGIPSGLPEFRIPAFRPELVLTLLSPAVTVAMLGAIESLLSAVVADRMGGDRHNPNTELFAQGVANIVSPLFGGLPATPTRCRRKAEFHERLGEANICNSLQDALDRAAEIVKAPYPWRSRLRRRRRRDLSLQHPPAFEGHRPIRSSFQRNWFSLPGGGVI
jgi:sulfate permease, SulP family